MVASLMTQSPERELFERFSRGELDRRELARALDREVLFGDALLKLYEYGLPLPRIAPNLDAPGVQVLREVLRRQVHG